MKNRKVLKYTLGFGDYQSIDMPKGSEILKVDNLREVLCVWAIVNPFEEVMERRRFEVCGTDHFIEDKSDRERKYLNTVQFQKGRLVFHVFENMESF